ncbi:DegT/DnrJ/EryC1/StrS family aminotransferase [Nostoc sp. CENA543]|uniref:DegT/DnrJ/EryC1/StrS family aminotransferase n=1 Tax=Nostoc sp. CENA543 TaxID=1869241 RepID=UPI0012FFDB3D|nr:DegT/DnrJ/EryC1/StrS family aminotransferase [Nostoc sp. CENA543]
MIPRKRLDITWADMVSGIGYCLRSPNREMVEQRIERLWSEKGSILPCLSVRSGFDALLQALNFEPGTEILVSAITIRGMTRIIEAHGLVAVPIDIDCKHLIVRPESMAKAVTPRTKAILVAHLFGSYMPMEPILQFAQAHNLLVIEDCAQAYVGNEYRGHPQSDVSLFSFGPIKTATALAGGILQFRDASLCHATRLYQEQWPVQSRWRFLTRILKYSILIFLSYRLTYSIFLASCSLFKLNHDRLISQSVRGFSGDNFLRQIRQRPSSALLSLMERRIRKFDPDKIVERAKLAEYLIKLTPSLQRPGSQAIKHTHWVFPILCDSPEKLMHYLWSQGFDATQGGSSLSVVEPPAHRPEMNPVAAQQFFEQLLYLPVYVGMSSQDIERLACVLNECDILNHDVNATFVDDSAIAK